MPISANLTHLSLRAKYLGLDITSAKQIYLKCPLSINRSTSNTETNVYMSGYMYEQQFYYYIGVGLPSL